MAAWLERTCGALNPNAARLDWPAGGDFNLDGAFTISDLWSALGWGFHLPGDLFMLSMQPRLGRFLEYGCADLGGWVSAALSAAIFALGFVWLAWLVGAAVKLRDRLGRSRRPLRSPEP